MINENNIKNKAVNGAISMTTITIVNTLLQLVITSILARLLLPEDYGAVASIQIVISFAEIFWMLGVGPALVQKKNINEKDIYTANTLNILFGLIIYIIIVILQPLICNLLNIENKYMLLTLSLVFIIHSISGVSESLLQRNLKFKTISLLRCITTIFNGIFTFYFALIGLGAWAIILGSIFSTLVKTIVTLLKEPVRFRLLIDKTSLTSLLHFGFGLTISKVFSNLASQGDYIVVSNTLGSNSLGLYTRAYQLIMIPTNLLAQVTDVILFPILARNQNNQDKLRNAYNLLSVVLLLITLPISIIGLVYANELIGLFLGENWLNIVVPFKILILSLFFRNAYKISDVLFRSVGAIYSRIKFQVLYAILIILGGMIGQYWGIEGVAISTSIAIVLNYFIMLYVSSKLIQLNLFDLFKSLMPILLSGLITFFISIIFKTLILHNNFINLSISIFSISLIYLISFFVVSFRLLDKYTKDFIIEILKKVNFLKKRS